MFSQGWLWQLGIGLGLSSTFILFNNPALAQSNIVPDSTLGAGENSLVTPNFNGLPVEVISGGAQREQNLFHSFSEFNVAANRGAYFFSGDAAIENILARVTGGNPSEILGTLGTFGDSQPNLFLINPNGIIFGEDVKLDVGGSFVATTANAVGLGNRGRFSASEPDTSNLLNINPDVFFFNRLSHRAEIVNRSTGTTPVLGDFVNQLPIINNSGLQVLEGKSLLLLGGDVRLEGGVLRAPGGRVELGGLSESGIVELNGNGNNLSLSFPDELARADVSLTNGGQILTAAGGGGSIVINAQTVDILDNSFLFTGILSGNGSVDSKAGDIEINAREQVTVSELSFIANAIFGIGDGGDIKITTGSVEVTNGAQLIASTVGEGNAGSVKITATDTVRFDGVGSDGTSSAAISSVEAGAVGNGGEIEITTGSLEVTNGATLSASTFGEGNAGGVKITANDTVRFDGVGSDGTSSVAISRVEIGAVGDGGDIEITTGSLEVTNGATLSASTFGEGNAGGVKITANDTVNFDGSFVLSQVGTGAVGNGSDIEITTGFLEVTNGAQLSASTFGKGSAGSMRIIARDTVLFDGVGSNGLPSRALSEVEAGAVGDGSDIEITTGSLEVRNGAFLSTSIRGEGNAGDVKITATDTVLFDGVGSNRFPSGAFSQVETGAVGDGSDIEITTGFLELTNGAVLSASTGGEGNAGSIDIITDSVEVTNGAFLLTSNFSREGNAGGVKIRATDKVRFDNGNVFSAVGRGAVGNGGDIEITTDSVEVTNGAILSANTLGKGNAGNVRIHATDTVRFDGGSDGIPTGVTNGVEAGAVGNSGNIEINASSVELTNGAALNTTTLGKGNAGGVKINASDTISLDGSVVSSSVEVGAVGNGNNIEITTGSVEVTNGAQVITSTFGEGNAGDVKIRTTDRVRFDGIGDNGFSSAAISQVEVGAIGDGGDIEITTGSLEITNSAGVSASTLGKGNAGNIRIHATDTVRFDGSNAFSSVASGAIGKGGDIEITAGSVSLTDASITSESEGSGSAGDIIITTQQNLETNHSNISATTLSGDGGDITLQVGDLLLIGDNNKISTTAGVAGAGGDGGDITIDADFVIGVPREDSDITANAFNGKGGNIIITTQGIFGLQFRDRLTPLSDITASSEFGLDGEFQLNLLSPIDVAQSIVDLPSNLVDATKLIDRRCTPGNPFQQSSFYITGRGGIPQNPTQMLDADAIVSNWVTLDAEAQSGNKVDTNPISTTPDRIIEAQGIVRTPDGQLYLAAKVPTVTLHGEWIPGIDCYNFHN